MIRLFTNRYFLILTGLLLASCSGLKHLPAGEKLYTGADIKLTAASEIQKKEKRRIKAALKDAVRPKPNKAYFGLRPKLWMYGAAGEDPGNKFKQWLQKKGEAPVLMSSVKPKATASILDARLFNLGIFKGSTTFSTVEKSQTAKIIYTSFIHEPYKVKELRYDISDDSISHLIISDKKESLIKEGNNYDLGVLKNERIRIDALLKDKGYFFFNPDYLLFKADTSVANQTADLKLTLRDSVPKNALTVYRINHVFINQQHSLNADPGEGRNDSMVYQNVIFRGKESEMNIRPKVILRSVYLKKNDIYSRKNHKITLNRLMSMGNFKFLQVKFAESDTTAPGYLDVTILMTPMPKRSFRAEVEIVSKSNNYTGPRMNLSTLNRNTFHGAELLNLNLAGSFETQLSGKNKNMYSYSWNPQLELKFPQILQPFKLRSKTIEYIPQTRFLVSYNYLKRVGYFDMSTFQFIYGYKWRKNIREEHEFNPINISFTSIGNKSTVFTDLLESNPFLKKSYEEQFIAGASYSYTYNEQVLTGKRIQNYAHLTSEIAGNLFSLANTIGGEKISPDNPGKIVGSVYSQFMRLSLDFRSYYNFANKNKFGVRVFAGLAKPYGNSSILPYNKQFFSGGPNSIRAFRINSLGPGNYHQELVNTGFLQLGGDIKLEMTAEYRFTIFRFFKGALFADAGNVWLLKTNPSPVGSSFSFGGIFHDMAVGAGIGLRVDVSFFILRFDLATPLRKPWLANDNKWVINQMHFGNSAWRGENLILNVAIGYPF